MSKRRRRERTCKGKVRYRDQAEALRTIRGLGENSRRDKLPGRAYQCPRCQGWHLTSRP